VWSCGCRNWEAALAPGVGHRHQESGRRVKADTARARMGESDREETGGGLAFDPWDTKSPDVGHDGVWNRRPGTEVRRRQGRKRPLRPGKLRGGVGYMSRGSQPTGLSVQTAGHA